ncbi:MAG TPA: hypothetical protein ENN60_01210 [archaeon]|nr:hypothetical protein [archaeon]
MTTIWDKPAFKKGPLVSWGNHLPVVEPTLTGEDRAYLSGFNTVELASVIANYPDNLINEEKDWAKRQTFKVLKEIFEPYWTATVAYELLPKINDASENLYRHLETYMSEICGGTNAVVNHTVFENKKLKLPEPEWRTADQIMEIGVNKVAGYYDYLKNHLPKVKIKIGDTRKTVKQWGVLGAGLVMKEISNRVSGIVTRMWDLKSYNTDKYQEFFDYLQEHQEFHTFTKTPIDKKIREIIDQYRNWYESRGDFIQ